MSRRYESKAKYEHIQPIIKKRTLRFEILGSLHCRHQLVNHLLHNVTIMSGSGSISQLHPGMDPYVNTICIRVSQSKYQLDLGMDPYLIPVESRYGSLSNTSCIQVWIPILYQLDPGMDVIYKYQLDPGMGPYLNTSWIRLLIPI